MADAMRRFWDRRAREDPFFFVDTRLDYGRPDEERFWAAGEEAYEELLGPFAVSVAATDEVIEIGCGIGRMTRAIAARAARVRALDVSPRMIELAQEHNADLANVDWLVGDGTTLSGIEDRSADACLSCVVFQHLPDPAITYGYVREMGRVLRPGGWAAFQVSDDPSIHRPRGLSERLFTRLRRGPRGAHRPEWLGSAVEMADLRAAATGAGLTIEAVEGAGTQYCLVLARAAGAAV